MPIFNSNRMVQDYDRRFYKPCSVKFNELRRDDMIGATELAEWRKKIMTGWKDVSVVEISSGGSRETMVGDEIGVSAR
ncbi:MAG: hypothetical protein P8Y36_10690, partial [Alphaproteobacteria bacterium]